MATTVNRKHASQSSSRRRTRLPWRTSTYDDEKLLRTILAQNLIASWRSIHQRYNDAAPATRQRSVDAVTSKGKEIYRQHRLQSSTYWCEDFIPQSSNESSESSIVQDNPDTNILPYEFEPVEWDLETNILPYEFEPVEWDLEMIIASWSNPIPDWEFQAPLIDAGQWYDLMCKTAMEAAAGIST